MNATTKIRQQLTTIMREGDAMACSIWKGWGGRHEGWHYTPFGKQPVFIGRNMAEVMEYFEQVREYQEEVKAGRA